jgi:glycosyltransferase involved in cell wall biosynthesis
MIRAKDITLAFVCLERHNLLQLSLKSVEGHPSILVCDNGSSNATNKNLIKAYAKKTGADYFRNETNEGLPKAWNLCTIISDTDWVALCPDDVIFRANWLESVNKILEIRPKTKIILGNNYNMILLHKSIIPVLGWWEERYKQYPSSEDYDFHLRLTELIGFSPYTMPGDHVVGSERQIRLSRKTIKEQYFDLKNFTYWCTSEFSVVPVLCDEIPQIRNCDYFKKNPNQETGYDFHNRKWRVCEPSDDGALLNIDGQYWKRLMPDFDPYPDTTEIYRKTYQ